MGRTQNLRGQHPQPPTAVKERAAQGSAMGWCRGHIVSCRLAKSEQLHVRLLTRLVDC